MSIHREKHTHEDKQTNNPQADKHIIVLTNHNKEVE